MNIDAGIKRFFPLLVLSALGIAAYFQASGVGELVSSTIGDTPAKRPAQTAVAPIRSKLASGKPILARNPFDSVTGPLDGAPPAQINIPDAPEPSIGGEPTDNDPACDFGRVLLITAAQDPAYSFASIQGTGGSSQLRRIGDDVDGHKVESMAWNQVWLTKDATRCQMTVGDKPKGVKAKPAPKKSSSKRRRSSRGKLPAEIAKKIHKVSATEFNVERSVVDEILDKQAELMRYTRLRPVKNGDKTVGLRLSRIRKDTLLDTLGLKNGDQVQSINGFELTNPQKALEAYGRLRTADRLSLTMMRDGKPVTIDFNIQ